MAHEYDTADVLIDDAFHEDLAWTYPEPVGDGRPIRGLIRFFNERVDLEVGGAAQERPVTSGRALR